MPLVSQARRSESGKSLVPLLGVLSGIAVIVAGVAIFLQIKEHQLRVTRETELRQVQLERDDLALQLDELEQLRARIEEDLGRTRQELQKSQEELAKAVEQQTKLARSVEDREKEIGRLSKDLSEVRTQAQAAADELTKLQAERETLKKQLADLESAKGALTTKVVQMANTPSVELDKVVVSSNRAGGKAAAPSAAPARPATSSAAPITPASGGQVVVVNREYDFVVMNLGKNHGLSVGQEFQIFRNNEVLGKVKVEKVYDELSAAAILPESRKDRIREGDSVKAL